MQWRFLGVVAGVLLGVELTAALSRESPFLSKMPPVATVVSETPPLELCGTMRDGGGLKLGIFDVAKAQAFWIAEGEGGHPFVVRSYDEATATASVDYAGRTLRLGSSGPVRLSPSAKSNTPANTLSAAEEARRVETLMANVRRMRDKRRAAAAGTPTTVPAPMPALPPR